MGLIFKDADRQPVDAKVVRKRAIILATPFALIGIFALVLFFHDALFVGGLDRRKAFTLLSAIATSVGFVALIFGINAKKEAIAVAAKKETAEKPWFRRDDWAAGRITSTSKKPAVLLWIIVLFWCGASLAISLAVVPAQLHQGNRAALMVLIFPIIGLALIFFACQATFAWRRFRQSIFEMAVVPAPAGGVLAGQINVPGNPKPKHGWHLALRCVRRATTGPTNNLRTTEKVLWQDEKWLRPDLLHKDTKATGIPVFFQLPGDKPESTPDIGDGTHWRLEAWAQLPGPDFRAAFEVPVFKLPGQQEVPTDPTLDYQLSLDEIRKQIRSRIQILELPERKEFIFPPGRNPGFATGATILCVIWTAIVMLLFLNRAPLPVPVVFGAIDLLMLYFVLDLWFRRSHVTISSETVKIETAWAGFKRETALKVSDAVNFFAEIGPSVGHSTYYDLKLRTRDGKELLLAKNLGHKPEADWLAQKMTAAARNVSATKTIA